MFLQDNDPHHMHVDFSYVFYFLILALIVGAAALYFGWKLMRYLDERSKKMQPEVKDPETESENEGVLK